MVVAGWRRRTVSAASKLKLADALAAGDTQAIVNLTSRIAAKTAASQPLKFGPENPDEVRQQPYAQATAERQ